MTLTLNDEEVVVYMTMKQHILDKDIIIANLESRIEELELLLEVLTSTGVVPEPSVPEEDIPPVSTSSTPSKSSWTQADEDIIKYIFNHKGIFGDCPLEKASAQFPSRTVGAVGTELRHYGFYTRKGLLKYPKTFRSKY